mgnify:CR=1 FL=1
MLFSLPAHILHIGQQSPELPVVHAHAVVQVQFNLHYLSGGLPPSGGTGLSASVLQRMLCILCKYFHCNPCPEEI